MQLLSNSFHHSSQGKKQRQHGVEAIKSHILSARTVANLVKTSLVYISLSIVFLFYFVLACTRDNNSWLVVTTGTPGT